MESRLKNSVKFLIILLIFGAAMLAMSVTARAEGQIVAKTSHQETGQGFNTLQGAIDEALQEGSAVELLSDVTESVNIKSVPVKGTSFNRTSLRINFNGHTLTGNGKDPAITIGQAGGTDANKITVELSGGTVKSTSKEPAIYNYSYNSVTIEDMAVENDSSDLSAYCIVNSGHNGWQDISMTLNNVKVNGNDDAAALIENKGQDIPNDTTNPKLTIDSGTFTGGQYAVRNDTQGILEINGGTFTSQTPILNWHEAVINDGTFIAANNQPVILNGRNAPTEPHQQGDLEIRNGVFKGGIILGMIQGAESFCKSKPITISGGDFRAVPQFFDEHAAVVRKYQDPRETSQDVKKNNFVNVTGGIFRPSAIDDLTAYDPNDPEKYDPKKLTAYDLGYNKKQGSIQDTEGGKGYETIPAGDIVMVAPASMAKNINKTIDDLKKENADLTGKLDTANKELDQVQNELTQTKTALGTAQGELQATQTELQQTQKELKNAQNDIKNLNADLQRIQDDLTKDIEQAKKDLAQANEDLKQANQDLSQANQDLNDANESLSQVEQERDEITKTLNQATADLQQAQKDLQESSDEVEKLRQQIETLTNQNKELTDKNTELSGKNDTLTTQNTDLNSQILGLN